MNASLPYRKTKGNGDETSISETKIRIFIAYSGVMKAIVKYQLSINHAHNAREC